MSPNQLSRFFCLLFLVFGYSLSAQDLSSLSDQGYGHWVTATRLSETATDLDDYLLIANEYERIIESDPAFADTYLKLVQLYEKIGMEKGLSFLERAEQVLDQYASIKPDDGRSIATERAYINALRDKYNNGPTRFVGKWGFTNTSEWDIEIAYEGGEYSLHLSKSVTSITKESDISFVIESLPSTTDHTAELRRKGWTRYVDDRDENADPGFPTSGRYYYNKDRLVAYYRIKLEGDAPVWETIKLHKWYYLDGDLTYAQTLPGAWLGGGVTLIRK